MEDTRKLITFDLDTNALKVYYPKDNWNHAYDVIRNYMRNNGFEWLQGSAYVSKESISSLKTEKILKGLISNNQWLHLCMRDCKETEVGKMYQKNELFDKNIKLETREEIIARKMNEVKKNISYAHDQDEIDRER